MGKTPLMQLLSCSLNNIAFADIQIQAEQWESLYALAKRHKVANILACALSLLPSDRRPESELCKKLEGILFQEALISSNQLFAARELQEAFEAKGIYNLMLKGINTKQRYPQDNMRSMGDLDILCKAEQNAQIRSTMEVLGYTEFQEGRKHDHYSRKPFISVEMHRELVPADSEFGPYYANIWERCKPIPGCRYSYVMTAEDEYIFNLIHLVEHFKEGGIGIRFVMDVYVYETLVSLDREYVDTELKKLRLWNFYQNIVRLSKIWFSPEPPKQDALLKKLEEYILSGGVFGSAENAAALSVSKGGKIPFLLKACFPSYKEMRSMFPWLEKWPILLPYSWLLRAMRSLLHRKNNVRRQFRIYQTADQDRGNQLIEFYHQCGLDDL